jgi:uncharacterized RDD family membrane protein YckC
MLILFGIGFAAGSSAIAAAVVMLVWFVLRNFYFIGFELAWRGQTPGKRLTGLRVVAADGGPLEQDQIFARNLTREAEVFLPLIAISVPHLVIPEAPVWALVATIVWTAILAGLPLANERSARLGDLVAGTVVVRIPRVVLGRDVVDDASPAEEAEDEGPLVFTDAQLSRYGELELHALEDILRRQETDPDWELMELVQTKIMRKIGWPGDPSTVRPEPFLRAFYAAQRARLEHNLVMGERRLDQYDENDDQ